MKQTKSSQKKILSMTEVIKEFQENYTDSNCAQSEPETISRKYIDLIANIKEHKDEMIRSRPKNLDELLEYTNNLFKNVYKPSTLKLDAEFLTESTFISSTHLEKDLRTQEISTERFVDFIRNRERKLIDFHDAIKENYRGVTFPVRVNLHISNDRIETPRRTFQRSQIPETLDAEIPVTLSESKEEDTAQKKVDNIKNIILQRQKIEYFRLVIDPQSYSKTIENMFYLSFIVKQNMCGLSFENNTLFVTKIDQEKIKNNVGHVILDIEYSDYIKIIEKLNIKQSLIKY